MVYFKRSLKVKEPLSSRAVRNFPAISRKRSGYEIPKYEVGSDGGSNQQAWWGKRCKPFPFR